MALSREDLQRELLRIFEENFEIDHPGLDDDLRDEHEFDSIDAIELLSEIERILGVSLSQEEKKQAMGVRTINQICDYVESLAGAGA
ncbi:acyl carrier protein [Desulfococcus sp.]|uniref:acyl carrier protein n=1 Tax=Desulfococcus sp. TaxID=2025834 RepID=UPI0035937292